MINIEKNKDVRCQLCCGEFNQAEVNRLQLKECPNCGSMHGPIKISEDMTLKINWGDIRTLALYSQRWVQTFDLGPVGNKQAVLILHRILGDLLKQKPEGAEDLNPYMDVPEVAEAIDARKIRGIKSPFFRKIPPQDEVY